ncbi:Putative WD40/YVTN repeat-like-containing domain superfamily [Septoria linicola]|uniref:Mitochondrial division protein 1 n=1 Tax=Septoria linicola TaxID=215465 RepID=A0A9Q9EMK7_9PEZI|nr:Putative WD40/YVTN repeat-like-containing domain superfamily [Septoria linicola]
MSRDSSQGPQSRSPKRRRLSSQGINTPQYEETPDAQLSYAYDDDVNSDAFHTPKQDSEEEGGDVKRQQVERPRRLNYVPHMTLRGHKRGVAAVKFSPDGKWIASCSADSTIKIWNAHTGAITQTLEGHLAGISTIAWSPDSKVIASGSDDKIIRLWDITTGKCLHLPLVGHHNYVFSIAFSPKGNMLVSGSYDEAVFLWDVRTARLMRSLPAHSDPVRSVDFVRDGTLIASCSSDGLIRIWDTATGQCLKTLIHEDNAPVTNIKFSPNGKFILASSLDNALRLWDYVTGDCKKTYQGHKNEKFSMHAAFGTYTTEPHHEAPSGQTETTTKPAEPTWAFIVSGSEDGKATVWDVSSKEVMQELAGHEGAVLGCDVAPDRNVIVTCGTDKTIKIWRREPLAPEMLLNGNGVHTLPDAMPVDSAPASAPPSRPKTPDGDVEMT